MRGDGGDENNMVILKHVIDSLNDLQHSVLVSNSLLGYVNELLIPGSAA